MSIGQCLLIITRFHVCVPIPLILVAGGVRELAKDAVAHREHEREHTVAAVSDRGQVHRIGQDMRHNSAVGREMEEPTETSVAVSGTDGVKDSFPIYDVADSEFENQKAVATHLHGLQKERVVKSPDLLCTCGGNSETVACITLTRTNGVVYRLIQRGMDGDLNRIVHRLQLAVTRIVRHHGVPAAVFGQHPGA